MSEELKRRLVGAGVLLFVFSMIAWWVGSKDDQSGELPSADAQIRNYDIRELDRIAAAQQVQQPEREPVADISAEPEYADKVETVEAVAESDPETEKPEETVTKAEEPATKPAASQPKPAPEPEKTEKTVAPEATQAKTTEPPPAKPKADPKGGWIVQVASVTQKSSAQGLVDRLKSKGWTAFLTEAQVNGKTYFRVRVGPYSPRSKAEDAANGLKKELGQDVAVLSR